ncbi:MAG: hypothetical protein M1160_02280 [Candidatus Marsarchaeota archaeon]|jgi:hypothetical protein|nr:hypothetical protein [Candidatus Marsarchaeota archaeon]MCL5111687.1 hypothetical protein [Candidatus Marsarchaeota archaeon]
MQYALSLFYTLAGALACLALIAVSDWGYSHGSIFIYEDADVAKLGKFSLVDLMESVRSSSNRLDGCSAVRHMAVAEEDVACSMSNRFAFGAEAKNLAGDEIRYALRAADRIGLIRLNGRYIERDGFGRCSTVARHIYDEWVRSGSGILAGTAEKLLEKEGVSMLGDWSEHGASLIALMGDEEEHLDSSVRTFSKDSAGLLLGLVNCNIRVTKC